MRVTHHTNKTSRTDGSSANAAHARGVSGITDGGRWTANLERVGDDRVRLTITKSNYASFGKPVDLVRDAQHDGYLRVERQDERERAFANKAALAARLQSDRMAELKTRVQAALHSSPGLSKSALATTIRARQADVSGAVDALVADGSVRKSSTVAYGFELVGGEPPCP